MEAVPILMEATPGRVWLPVLMCSDAQRYLLLAQRVPRMI